MDFRDQSISELVKRVKNKEISAKELTESALSNIEKFDDTINAFCALNSEDAIKQAKKSSNKISIIGGESVYREFMPFANKLLITEIDIVVEKPDTFFPAWNKEDWIENSRIKSEENGIKYSFVEYLRN